MKLDHVLLLPEMIFVIVCNLLWQNLAIAFFVIRRDLVIVQH